MVNIVGQRRQRQKTANGQTDLAEGQKDKEKNSIVFLSFLFFIVANISSLK